MRKFKVLGVLAVLIALAASIGSVSAATTTYSGTIGIYNNGVDASNGISPYNCHVSVTTNGWQLTGWHILDGYYWFVGTPNNIPTYVAYVTVNTGPYSSWTIYSH